MTEEYEEYDYSCDGCAKQMSDGRIWTSCLRCRRQYPSYDVAKRKPDLYEPRENAPSEDAAPVAKLKIIQTEVMVRFTCPDCGRQAPASYKAFCNQHGKLTEWPSAMTCPSCRKTFPVQIENYQDI